MFKKQGWHFLSLVVLLAGVAALFGDDFASGQLWGASTKFWFWFAIGVPVAHQIVVPIIWRGELYHQWMTKIFGDKGFLIYKIIFSILFIARPISVILVGISNKNTLHLNPFFAYILGFLLLIPAVYGMYSVIRYFGIDRAYGIDHFEPEIYLNKPFVKQGLFKYTDNAMYKFVFLALWAIGLGFLSKAALLVAAFNHLYIWVHFYFTELPDIRHIYGQSAE
ncbi:MAG: hypothetical protein HN736_01725 [Anaerolineae bacterium]|jgi:hypothetical protein|nr:hypothetical protein [Anaerolineae bacterium]MBT3714175.1 hypothetical protein [Anaerolineae bacterium]MBT4310774.1 hypothetical protein [Anaerolineae bacterium]MBT4458228.1 hypothetical protein [Anaerolineae bacterium]MBT4841017.1 hypothetical protein [Anaerolineae bacterium]